jgi:hypothetical protein
MEMKFVIIFAVLVLGAKAISLYDRDELMELNEELRAEIDAAEAKKEDAEIPEEGDAGKTCPVCSKGSTCCRYLDEFRCCAKIYNLAYNVGDSKITEQIEVNEEENQAKIYLEKGGFGIIDYEKRIAALYFPDAGACYLIGGIGKAEGDAKKLLKTLESAPEQQPSGVDKFQVAADATPLKDLTLLPEGIQQSCQDKPVYWTEKILPEKDGKRYYGGIGRLQCSERSYCTPYKCELVKICL